MNRCSLSRVVLMSKLLDMGTPKKILATALDPPSLKNIALTILTLKQVIFYQVSVITLQIETLDFTSIYIY